MPDMNSEAMKNFLSYTKACLVKKSKRSETSDSGFNEDVMKENRLIRILCKKGSLAPRRCADAMNEKYGYDLRGSDVIDIFKSFKITQEERQEMIEWAEKLGKLFMKALDSGKAEDYDAFLEKREENVNTRKSKRPKIRNRFACMKLCTVLPELGNTEEGPVIEKFGQVFAMYYLYDITDALAEYCNSDKGHGLKNLKAEEEEENKSNREVSRLEQALERSDMMLKDLQDEFDERLEESKVKEMADFFSRLNSDKYGRILDELLNVRKGVARLKKEHCELPPEIGGLLIMTQKLTQFVRDSGINPIMKPQEIKKAKAADIEFCDYDGSPFADKDEEKTVQVVSPGWIYSDKDLQIARPKVKEVEDNE